MKCIIIDVANVCRPKNIPTIISHLLKRKIVTAKGGTKFSREMSSCPEFIEIYDELERSGLLIKFNDDDIDSHMSTCENSISINLEKCPSECDDLHLFALSTKTNGSPIVTRDDKNMSICIRKLKKLNIDLATYKRPLVIKSDKIYLKAFNRNAF